MCIWIMRNDILAMLSCWREFGVRRSLYLTFDLHEIDNFATNTIWDITAREDYFSLFVDTK